MQVFTTEQMDAALTRVEAAKHLHPVGWAFLDELDLSPGDRLVLYAFNNANAHMSRLNHEEDHRVIYATGWLQGLAVGHELMRERQ